MVKSDPQHTEGSYLTPYRSKKDDRNIYGIMNTMCPPGYHQNDFVATHVLGHMMYGSVPILNFMYRNK